MADLKPCPFCGELEVGLNVYQNDDGVWIAEVYCTRVLECGAAVQQNGLNRGIATADAIETWNRRVTDGNYCQ